MNKSEITTALANLHLQLTNQQAKLLTDKLFLSLGQALSTGRRIEIRGFGSFSLKSRKAGMVRNPRHGTSLKSGPRHVVYFRAGQKLAKRVDLENN
jgi:integration host factor subunit beta